MVWHLFMAEDELGQRVGEGLGITADDVRGLAPLATQTLTEAELARAANLGNNGPRDVEGKVMTHCVPNERVALADEPVEACEEHAASPPRAPSPVALHRQRLRSGSPGRRPAGRRAPRTTARAARRPCRGVATERLEDRHVAAPADRVERRRHAARDRLGAAQHRTSPTAISRPAQPCSSHACGAVDRDVHAEAARVGDGAVERGRQARRRSPRTSATRRSRRAPSRPRRARAGARRAPRCSETAAASGPSTSRPSIRRPA